MRNLDQTDLTIKAIAEHRGVKLADHEIKPIRRKIEADYINSILDGRVPFNDEVSNGKEKRDCTR